MKGHTILFVLYLIQLHPIINAQSTLNTSASDSYTLAGSLDISIGEVFYIQKGQVLNLTEGIQNGITINPVSSKSKISVSVYPNPTNDLVQFKVQNLNFNNLHYRIYNNMGNEISHGDIVNINSTVSLSKFPSSIYLVKIYRGANEESAYKILKIN
jgi:ribosomal protein S17